MNKDKLFKAWGLCVFVCIMAFSCHGAKAPSMTILYDGWKDSGMAPWDVVGTESDGDVLDGTEVSAETATDIVEAGDASDMVEGSDHDVMADGLDEVSTTEDLHDFGSGEDAFGPATVLFRANDVAIVSPSLCLRLGSDNRCVIDTTMVNEALKASLQDAINPYNLLFMFDPFDFQSSVSNLYIGSGECHFEGQPPRPISCRLNEGSQKLDVYGVDCEHGSVFLECFEAQADRLEFYIKDIFLSFRAVDIRGQIRRKSPYKMDAEIVGFMPQNTAKSITISFGGSLVVTLFDFLRDVQPEENDGVVGYWFRLGVSASEVASF